ncbi:hypothetical protein TRFO_38954 [Tritrichomonas foetus]|uniref:Uncharacterized protein n=1 Tax=Tritrichomonas foetus TaxID=1144522 RepID=A0A1J4J6J8_9EUKA|nr:hypothetical protein TRFO_38954 [Tritrichomonas foetus]|eukprot:OHS94850.1 hypothetical protein TRFO_38954 [Tritrichomonas foetus]
MVSMIENVHNSHLFENHDYSPNVPSISLGCRNDKVLCNIPEHTITHYLFLDSILENSPVSDSEMVVFDSQDNEKSSFPFVYVHYPAVFIQIGNHYVMPANFKREKQSSSQVCEKMREAKKVKNNKLIEKNAKKATYIHKCQPSTNTVIIQTKNIQFHSQVSDVTKLVMENLLCNVTTKFKNWRHNEYMKRLSFIIAMYSPSILNIIRQIIPLPSMTTINNEFRNQVRSIRMCLTDYQYIEEMLNIIKYPSFEGQYRCCVAFDAIKFKLFEKKSELNETLPILDNEQNYIDEIDSDDEDYHEVNENIEETLCTQTQLFEKITNNEKIGIDECPMIIGDINRKQSIEIIREELKALPRPKSPKQFSNLFIALAMPLDYEIDNIVIHTIPHSNGQAGVEIREDFMNLLLFLRYHTRFFPVYACVDGDIGYSRYHREFYDFWRSLNSDDISKLIQYVPIYSESKPLFITDLIHYGKNRRSWLLFHVLTVHPTDSSFFLDIEKIKSCCDLGDILIDMSPLGKMQDEYPIGLFSIPVVKNLLEHNFYHEALYVLPVAFWFESVRNEKIDRETRILLLKLSFKINMKFINYIETNKLGHGIAKAGVTNNDKKRQYVAPLEALVRAVNTLLVMIYELQKGGTINFSRLSTMTEEHVNGQIRTGCRRNDSLESILSFLSKYNLGVSFINQMGIKTRKRRRDYQGGITFDDTIRKDDLASIKFTEVTDDMIINGFFALCGYRENIDLSNAFLLSEILYTFIEKLYLCHAPIKIPRNGTLGRSGESIISRNLTK